MPELNHEKQLIEDLQQLTESIKKVTKVVERVESKRYLQMLDHPAKFLLYSFLHGAFIALGSSIGVVVVLGIMAYILKSLQYIPFIGNYTNSILPMLHR